MALVVELAKTKDVWRVLFSPIAKFFSQRGSHLKLESEILTSLPTLEVKKSSYTWNSVSGFWLIFFCIWSF